jgi:D-alanyl-D-alanine carboxypeptidase
LKNKLIVSSLVLCALVAAAAFAALPGSGQSAGRVASSAGSTQPETPVPSAVKPTASIRETRAVESASASAFVAAASRNLTLRDTLSWAFGGKQQRGWYLYLPLIGQMLETAPDATTPEFASALSRWQKSSGLDATGVLDDETLYKMVSTWQGARMKDRGYPDASELVTAPPSDFWDPSRPDELRQVRRDAYASYKRMVAAAAADPSLKLKVSESGGLAPDEKFLKIVSSFRSREYQEQLRRQSPNAGRAGLAVNSPHFTGRALDIYVGGDPVETKDANRAIQIQTPVYRWLVRNAGKFGFRPYYYEPWHWEYVGETATNK